MIFSRRAQYLEQTLKLRPNYPEAWNNLGMIAAQEGHPDEAVRNFQQSLLSEAGLRDRAAEPGECLSPAAVL